MSSSWRPHIPATRTVWTSQGQLHGGQAEPTESLTNRFPRCVFRRSFESTVEPEISYIHKQCLYPYLFHILLKSVRYSIHGTACVLVHSVCIFCYPLFTGQPMSLLYVVQHLLYHKPQKKKNPELLFCEQPAPSLGLMFWEMTYGKQYKYKFKTSPYIYIFFFFFQSSKLLFCYSLVTSL